jgi:hypothetical protein
VIAKKIFLALTLVAVATLSATDMRAQSGEPPTTQETAQETQEAAFNGYCGWLCQLRERQAQQLEGSWVVTVTPVVPPGVPEPPSFRAYGTIARGGAFIGTDTRRLFNIQHGAWAHLGGNDFAWTFIEEVVDAMGNFAGTVKVRVKLTITGTNQFVGVSNAEERNAAGVVTAVRCGTIRGARITVEPLAPQCQSITPPQ